MKLQNLILLIFIFVLFCNGSCEGKEGQYFITIQNNSDEEIIFIWATHSMRDAICINLLPKREYQNFIHSFMIKPNSSRRLGIDLV